MYCCDMAFWARIIPVGYILRHTTVDSRDQIEDALLCYGVM